MKLFVLAILASISLPIFAGCVSDYNAGVNLENKAKKLFNKSVEEHRRFLASSNRCANVDKVIASWEKTDAVYYDALYKYLDAKVSCMIEDKDDVYDLAEEAQKDVEEMREATLQNAANLRSYKERNCL